MTRFPQLACLARVVVLAAAAASSATVGRVCRRSRVGVECCWLRPFFKCHEPRLRAVTASFLPFFLSWFFARPTFVVLEGYYNFYCVLLLLPYNTTTVLLASKSDDDDDRNTNWHQPASNEVGSK